MSGILVMFNTGGVPIDRDLFARVFACPSLGLRGPHNASHFISGSIAIGHTLLHTSRESIREQQPLSLDGRTWIVADGRVDARGDLIAALSDEDASVASSDVELIARAYRRWGEQCVERLLGDFAFVIWDSAVNRLFCARDHLGVKPFYYAHVGSSLIVSSTIESLRRHPRMSAALNEQAVADFLYAGFNQNPNTTTFRDIQRLAPAHTLTVSSARAALRQYWTLPVESLQYRRTATDYIDEFRGVVRAAVADRLRADRVSIYLSGGLDSSTLAVTSTELRAGMARDSVRGFCAGFERLFHDSEPRFARAVAEHLGVPMSYYPRDLQFHWSDDATDLPEPALEILDPKPQRDMHAEMACHGAVAFYGEGPDNALLYEWRPHLRELMRTGQPLRLMRDVAAHVIAHRRVPILPTLPKMLRQRLSRPSSYQENPPRFLRHVTDNRASCGTREHPTKPRAYLSLLSPQWQALFESCEPAYTGASIEVRAPYVDLRVLGFLLRVPSMPWSRSKYLMRRALVGRLPEEIHRRPKAPLAGDPITERLARLGPPEIRQTSGLDHFVDVSLITPDTWRSLPSAYAAARTAALSYWLETV